MDSESELISLISQLVFLPDNVFWKWDLKATSVITQIISLGRSMALNSQPESELMSLITQTISVFNSMDLDSQPKPLQNLVSFISRIVNYADLDWNWKLEWDTNEPLNKTLQLEPEPELMSLICQIFSFVISMNSKSGKFICLCPQVQVYMRNGKFHVSENHSNHKKWDCFPGKWLKFKITGEDATYFFCVGCEGKNHEEFEKAPVEIKHHLHRKHSLQLVFMSYFDTRECYCCGEDLAILYYYCSACDFAINIACASKPAVLSIDHPKCHEHTLALFPRHASLTCNLCALADASSPIYMCPPCDFVLHQKCIKLPRVIRISRHHHRISFTPSFDQRDNLSCAVCRRNIEHDYGGYSCIMESCSYAVHSRCATQRNVWDGKELEGVPDEDIGEVQPFVRIGDGIRLHHLRLDVNTSRDYDENMECQICKHANLFW